MEIYTLGYTKKSAEEFFERLRAHGIRRVLDIRLHNTSQLAGFSKRDDLAYFLREIVGAEYIHEPRLAPTEELLAAWQARALTLEQYAEWFSRLLTERRPEEWLDRATFEAPTVLLCAEPTPDECHRRLVAEHLKELWGDVTIIHL